MPYLRMFLGERVIDDVYIPESLLQSVISTHILQEEKQRMIDRHAVAIRSSDLAPSFFIESIPSEINSFSPLGAGKKSE